MTTLDDAPAELQVSIKEFWPQAEWDHAAQICELESGFDAFAENDTTEHGTIPCGTVIGSIDGVAISAEHSIGYFQINVCNFPAWPSCRLFNGRHNAGTAHLLWSERGWQPWYRSAVKLGLI